jgi:hypothetical protein
MKKAREVHAQLLDILKTLKVTPGFKKHGHGSDR